MALLLNILKPRNELEEGGRKAAPVQQDEGEPEKVCPNCRKRTSISTLWANKMVCGCGYHFHMKARQRILMLSDKDSFRELFEGLHGDNPLSFPGYQRKLDTVRSASGEDEAVICGTARISGIEVCIFAMEAHFMMGSMGSAVGEKITRLFETALAARMPVIGYVVSGGARMQEGLFSLMQMAKTSAAVKRHSDAGLLYISILTDPTTGGVTASFGMEADIILATGGPGMVKAAYSSGKPALGVGAGNVPAVIDDSADLVLAVNSIIHSKTFDNGMICASEQSVIVLDSVYEAVKTEFADRGCWFLKDRELDKVRHTILINGALNAKIVGQSACRIAALAGVDVPEGTKVLIGEVESVALSE